MYTLRAINLIVSAAFCVVLTLPVHAQSPAFSVKELPMLPGDTTVNVWGINNSGDAVGVMGGENCGTNCTAVIWHSGTVTPLAAPPGAINYGSLSINNAGQVAGLAVLGVTSEAVVWNDGTPTVLPAPDSQHTETYATHINDAGEVSGGATEPGDAPPAVAIVWNGKTPTVLESPAGFTSAYANAVNDTGLVVGYACCSSAGFEAIVWHGTTPSLLAKQQPAATAGGEADAVNNSGLVVGQSFNTAGDAALAAAWADRTIAIIGAQDSIALGINNRGIIVGKFGSPNRAAIWASDKATVQDLNSLISAAAANEVVLTQALGINDNCVIIAQGVARETGKIKAFVLTLNDSADCVNGLVPANLHHSLR
jgi:uncharacterized membrane protein